MATHSIVQVLEKSDYTQQNLCTLPASAQFPALAPSSVRIRTKVIALTTNNIAYAIGGSFLHWWDTYPVPDSVGPPYNDNGRYGTVPGWGYAEVLESTTSIRPGTYLKGYFPMSTVPSDLQLTAAPVSDHWIESSSHRAKIMPLYHRYIVTSTPLGSALSSQLKVCMGWDSLIGVLWECAYLFNHFVFSNNTKQRAHPSGTEQPWAESDADLSKSTVILLAASGKTALCFADQLRNFRDPGTGPLAVVGVTSGSSVPFLQGTHFYNSVLSYDELGQLPYSVAHETKRILVVDFGSRGTVAEQVLGLSEAKVPSESLTMIGIGSEVKPYKPEDMGAVFERFQKLKRIQANTSGLRDMAMQKMGEANYFESMSKAWQLVRERKGGPIPGMELSWGEGMIGENGVEGGWKKLCAGDVTPDKGLVFEL